VAFADGSRMAPAAVIWATGFAVDHSFVQVPVFDDAARLMHHRGVTAAPGLYFLGLTWQHTRGSALLGWVKDDAEFIAAGIAAHADGKPAAAVAQPATGGRPPHES
jgi:putative flavoprotein involved in K+ transport